MFGTLTLRPYLLRLRELGLIADTFDAGGDITWQRIDRLEPIGPHAYSRLLDMIAQAASTRFAQNCGFALNPRELGLLGITLQKSGSVRHALEVWCRFADLVGYPMTGTFQADSDSWQWQLFPKLAMTPRAARFCVDATLASYFSMTTELTGEAPVFTRLDLPFSRPADPERYDYLRARQVVFGAPRLRIVGEARSLSRPVRSADRAAFGACLKQCSAADAEDRRRISVVHRLHALFAQSPGALPGIDELAAALGHSPRTLQRRLAAEGQTYSDLVREFRLRTAATLQNEASLPMKEIAFRVGYRDRASLYRLRRASEAPAAAAGS